MAAEDKTSAAVFCLWARPGSGIAGAKRDTELCGIEPSTAANRDSDCRERIQSVTDNATECTDTLQTERKRWLEKMTKVMTGQSDEVGGSKKAHPEKLERPAEDQRAAG